MIAPAARARTIGPTERTRVSARTASRPAAGGAPRPSPRAVLDAAAEPPPREHGDPVAQVDELLEVGGDDERRDPPLRLLADARPHRTGRPHVEPVRRLAVDHRLRLEGELAREQHLLDVAAGERGDPRSGAGRPDVEARDEVLRGRVDGPLLDDAAPPEGRLADALQDDVERDREAPDRALAQTVVRHVAEAEPLAPGDAEGGDRPAPEADLAGGERPLAGDRLGQLPLAVAVDARDAQDLTGP